MANKQAVRLWRQALVVAAAASAAAVGAAAQSTAEPLAAGGTTFASTKHAFTLVLPEGWREVPASLEPGMECCDVFDGDGLIARVNAGTVPAGSIVEDRVAGNRARDAAEGICTSDPAEDRTTTLGGEHAIEWHRRCPTSIGGIVQAVHGDTSYHLEVDGPSDSEATVEEDLERFRSTLAFVDVAASSAPDLAALDAALQGTWQTEWYPTELALATVRAAGLDPAAGDPGWQRYTTAESMRSAVRFDAGDITQYGAADGGPLEVGWFGTYTVTSPETIEAIEGGAFNTIVYEFTLHDDVLAIDVVSDAGGMADLVPQTAIYETLPFTKVP